MNQEIKEILDMLKDSQYIPSDDNRTYKLLDRDDTRHLLDYITNLQQAIEVKNERIKEEQQEKERYIKFYNELNIWNKELQQENERLKEEYKNKLDKTLEVLQYELQFQTGGCYHRLSNLFDYLQNGSDDND